MNMTQAKPEEVADVIESDPRVEQAGILIRAGFEPDAALAAVGLPSIEHTGLVPITVKPIEEMNGNGGSPQEETP